MSQVIRIPSSVYIRLEKHALGFDTPANVIERLLDHYEGVVPQVPEIPPKGKDTTQYYFNSNRYRKGRLVLAVVQDYVFNHSDLTVTDLKEIFPNNLQGSMGVFQVLEHAKEHPTRYYVRSNEIIKLTDDDVAVSNQWGINNINNFILKAEGLGYSIRQANSQSN